MLIYFQENRARYDKGQLAPFFILILVLVITMAIVTMNLAKVALLKTESANAADAAALASGSVMANVFNNIAQANSQLEAGYWQFYSLAGISFALIVVLAALGMVSQAESVAAGSIAQAFESGCEGTSCGAIAKNLLAALKKAFSNIQLTVAGALADGVTVAYGAFHSAQFYLFKSIKKAAREGRLQAITLGSKFAFMNANIASKLKEGAAPTGEKFEQLVQEISANHPAGLSLIENFREKIKHNYRKEFSKFLAETVDAKKGNLSSWTDPDDPNKQLRGYVYEWIDGQGREHSVGTAVSIDEVDDFELRVTVVPFLAELATMEVIATLLKSGIIGLIADILAAIFAAVACAVLGCCHSVILSAICCPIMVAFCVAAAVSTAIGIILSLLAQLFVGKVYYLLPVAMLGLLPGPTVGSAESDTFMFTICWLEKVNHNHLVRVDIQQKHQGRDFAQPFLWRTTYPATHSFSIVDFHGKGEIHDPVLRYDASIVATDGNAGRYDLCAAPRQQVSDLKTAISELAEKIGSLQDEVDAIRDFASPTEAQRRLAQLKQQAGSIPPVNTTLPDESEAKYYEEERKTRAAWEAEQPVAPAQNTTELPAGLAAGTQALANQTLFPENATTAINRLEELDSVMEASLAFGDRVLNNQSQYLEEEIGYYTNQLQAKCRRIRNITSEYGDCFSGYTPLPECGGADVF